MTFESRIYQPWLDNYRVNEDYYNPNNEWCSPNKNVQLSYALFLIKSGKLKEVLDLVFNFYINNDKQINTEHLHNIICAIVDYIRKSEKEILPSSERHDAFSCPLCYGVLSEPLTQSCGHTFCKKCLIREEVKVCKLCVGNNQPVNTSQTHPNILIVNLVNKFWPEETKGTELRNRGSLKYFEKDFQEALDLYAQAIDAAPEDHLNYANRSHILHFLGRAEEALHDANITIKLCPQWAKGHFRRAKALTSLGRLEEAITSLLVCSVLEEPSVLNTITEELCTIFKDYLMKATPSYQRHPYFNINKMYRPNPRSIRTPIGTRIMLSDGEISSEDDYDGSVSTKISTSSVHINPYFTNYKTDAHSRGRKRKFSESLILSNNVPVQQENEVLHRILDKYQQDINSVKRNINNKNRSLDTQFLDKNDFECPLCFRLLHEPVTTPCGHTFCRSCLNRCLDHAPCCALCKTSLKDYLAKRNISIAGFLQVVLQSFMMQEYNERCLQHQEDIEGVVQAGKDNKFQIPVFVATLALPYITCPLHVFEPRYRLMIRRCMEAGTREFGMCMPDSSSTNGYSDYGTMLEIRDIEYTPDGRAVVSTVGSRRFHTVSKKLKDGYDTANVEFFKDCTIPENKISLFKTLHDCVRDKAWSWFSSLSSQQKKKIINFHGSMPALEETYWNLPNGPSWLWWTIAILPISDRIQCKILQKTSLLTRLKLVEQILLCLSKNSSQLDV